MILQQIQIGQNNKFEDEHRPGIMSHLPPLSAPEVRYIYSTSKIDFLVLFLNIFDLTDLIKPNNNKLLVPLV